MMKQYGFTHWKSCSNRIFLRKDHALKCGAALRTLTRLTLAEADACKADEI